MNATIKKILKFLVPTAVLALSFWVTLDDVDYTRLWEALSAANMWWVTATLPIILVSHYLRAVRWRVMLEPVRTDISTWNAFSAVMIAYLFNNIIPRSGEIARPFIFARRENLPVSTSLASVFVERMIDVLSLAVLLILAVSVFSDDFARAFAGNDNAGPETVLIVLSVFIGVFLCGLYILLRTTLIQKFLALTVKRFSETFYSRALTQLQAFSDGFAVLSKPRLYMRVFVITVVMWTLYVVPLYMVFEAFSLQQYYSQFSMLDANVLCVLTSVAIAVAPTPGAAGVYHLATQKALENLYSVPREEAVAYAFVAHAIGFLTNLVVGAAFMARENSLGISWRGISAQPAEAVAGDAGGKSGVGS